MRDSERKAESNGQGAKRIKIFAFYTLHFILCALLYLPSLCFAEERTTLQSDTLEYEEKTSTYTAKGHVKIERGAARIEADFITYNEKTSEVIAEGNAVYEDELVRITATRAELHLDSKTGKIYEAEVFTKKDNYHIRGLEIEKTGEKEYALKRASFTTCDAPVPAWCFSGKDVDIRVGDRLKARNVTFRIKGLPVLYSPYLSAPIERERKTGLLFPAVAYIRSKGLHYEQPFFWAISENRDATFLLDVYGRRGVGEGIEYRYIERDGALGNFWLYHLRDDKLERNFWDLRGRHESGDYPNGVTGRLNVNYINSKDYYREYNPYIISKGIDPASYLNVTTGRFLESTGEVSLRLESSRAFLTAQYLIDLKAGADASEVPQRLPEIGYFMTPRRAGPLVFSLSSTLSHFWRETGAAGQRLDIFPRLSHSFGNDLVFTQALGLRETAYSLHRSGEFGDTPHRESFDYRIAVQTRLMKRYGSFMHILEPSLGFTYIPSVRSNLPLFDSTERYTKTSEVGLTLLNRFMDTKGEFLTLRISEAFDSYLGDRPFLPLRVEASLRRPLGFRGEATFDVHSGRVESVNSDLALNIPGALSFSVGERYHRVENILFYTIGTALSFSKALSAEGNFWYDAKKSRLGDIIAKVKYQKQCWGVTTVVTKRQNDYSISVLFDLLGLGTIKI